MSSKEAQNVLDRFVELDLAAEAAAGRLGRAYGREELLAAVEEVYLAGRSPVLIGEPGVGKTALVHELVVRATAGLSRVRLDGARVLQLSLRRGASTVADGEALGRLAVELVEALVELDREAVVYVRDLHLAYALDLEEHVSGLVRRLARPLLAEGEAPAMRSLFVSAPQLELHGTLLEVPEPSLAETRRILDRWVEQRERHPTGVRVRPEAVETSLQLAHRFLARSRMPRKALAPLEQVAALAAAEPAGRLAPGRRREVGDGDVLALFCRQYGLPRPLVDPREPLDLDALSRELGESVLGQPRAVEVAVSLLARIKAGLPDPQRPLGALLFVGPSGVGKTLLARHLAERALGSPDRMIRLNMADYPNDSDAGLLFGSPTSYQTAERQGLLTRRIFGCQFGVLLLDELEKASTKVHDRLLQLLDEGAFINGAGQTIPCRSLVIVATSNAGSGLWRDERAGFADPTAAPRREDLELEARLRQHFRFELLNRFDEIVAFAPLARADVRALVRRLLRELAGRPGLARLGVALELTDAGLEWILDRGHDPRNGVRWLRRTVEREVGTRVAELLVRAEVAPGDVVRLDAMGGALVARVARVAATAGRSS